MNKKAQKICFLIDYGFALLSKGYQTAKGMNPDA